MLCCRIQYLLIIKYSTVNPAQAKMAIITGCIIRGYIKRGLQFLL